jgi:alpha-1,2-mannosyltransferase
VSHRLIGSALVRRVYQLPCAALVAVAAVLAFVAYGQLFLWGHAAFLDLRVYLAAGHNLLLDRNPYDIGYTSAHLDATYPPFGLLLVSPLSMLPTSVAGYFWAAANYLALAWVVSMGLREVFPGTRLASDTRVRWGVAALGAALAVNVLEPVHADFTFGQINILLMALVCFDLLRSSDRGRGALVGLAAAVKLTPLVFLLFLVIRRDWPAVRRCLGMFVACEALAWLLRPAATAHYYLNLHKEVQHIGPQIYRSNQSWTGLLSRWHLFGVTGSVAWMVLSVMTLLMAAFVAARLLDRPGSRVTPVFLVAVAGLLISPISWTHHWSWVVLAPVVALDRRLPAVVRAAMVVLSVVAVEAPYWWLARGPDTARVVPGVLDNSLALAGFGVLAVAAWAVYRASLPETPTERVGVEGQPP